MNSEMYGAIEEAVFDLFSEKPFSADVSQGSIQDAIAFGLYDCQFASHFWIRLLKS